MVYRKRKYDLTSIISYHTGPHHIQHLENLRANGFATFKCDSFLSRGVASTSERQLACTMSNLQHDSYAALNLLATHPGIDSSRIGCTGWSLGGGAAVYNALDAIGNRLGGPFGVRFASHLGFYPAAHYRPRGNWKWAQVPIGIIQGELDDYSPTFMCKDLVNHALKQGARMALHIYPNAHHSFDRGNSMPVEFLPKVSKPTGTLDLQWPDGTLHVTGEPAGTAPATEYEERRKNGWKYCDRGAHAGGNAIETANAMRDTVEFFKQTLMGDAVLSHQSLPLMIKTEVTELQPPPGSAKL